MAAHVGSREELSHAVFNPHDGLAAQAFPTLRERREFTLTPQYAEIYRILGDLVRRSGGAPGARSQPSHEQSVRRQRQAVQTEGRERTP
jgi:hypothetical protein